ncbi:hypothetical protein LTR37_002065 [Vermiconidia calcicola]|uniref:Uncharacterized protein n=1 Tax=Vermiconidia calcicola TaxID=1690605 RepID=A0ACC3NTL2_9PEZI|nr:hypothetical protein LTR37_002065 [Vermiconidia calcicola]
MPNGKITWLNGSQKGEKKSKQEKKKQHEKEYDEVQLAYLSYGNEPCIDIHYSRAAMLIRIPPLKERISGMDMPTSIWEGIKRDYSEYDEEYDDVSDLYDDYDDYDDYSFSEELYGEDPEAEEASEDEEMEAAGESGAPATGNGNEGLSG